MGFKGTLQEDAFAGYDAIYEAGAVREAGRMAQYPEYLFMLRIERSTLCA